MKTRLLALLLCLVLVASALLMTACGGSKKDDSTDAATDAATSPAADKGTAAATGSGAAPADTAAVTGNGDTAEEEAARAAALGNFLKGIEQASEGGIAFTGTIKGTHTFTNHNWETNTDERQTETIDLNLALNYFQYVLDATMSGTVGDGDNVDVEFFYDGELVAVYSNTPEEEEGPAYEVYFLEDVLSDFSGAADLPSLVMTDTDADFAASMEEFAKLFDYDKLGVSANALTKNVLVFEQVNENTYKVSFVSDKVFDAALNLLNVVKANKDGTVGELIDALFGAGTVDKIKAELDKYHGSDKLKDILPDLEKTLGDLGLKVDDAYAYAADLFNQFTGATGEEAMDGEGMREMVISLCAELTVNDAISMAVSMSAGFGDDDEGWEDDGYGWDDDYGWEDDGEEEEYEYQGAVDRLESAMPGMPTIPGLVSPMGEDGEMTYESIKASVVAFMDVKVSDLALLMGVEDIGAIVDMGISYVTAFKEAFKVEASVITDKDFVPTEATLTIKIDTTKLPAEMEVDPTVLTIECKAEIKSTLNVAPINSTLNGKISEAKAAKETEAVTED